MKVLNKIMIKDTSTSSPTYEEAKFGSFSENVILNDGTTIQQAIENLDSSIIQKIARIKVVNNTLYLYSDVGLNNLIQTVSLPISSSGSSGGSSTTITEQQLLDWGFTKNTGTYSKPSGGIPKTDLSSAVQNSLNKADSALQSVPSGYATVSYVDDVAKCKVEFIPILIDSNNSVTCSKTYLEIAWALQAYEDTKTMIYLVHDVGDSTGHSIDFYELQYCGVGSGGEQIRFVNSQGSILKTILFNANGTISYFTTSLGGSSGDGYVKPTGGIPKSDLSTNVQGSLALADSAVQKNQGSTNAGKYLGVGTDGLVTLLNAQNSSDADQIVATVPISINGSSVTCSKTYSQLYQLIDVYGSTRTIVYLIHDTGSSAGHSIDFYSLQYCGVGSYGDQIRFVNFQGSLMKVVTFYANGTISYTTGSPGSGLTLDQEAKLNSIDEKLDIDQGNANAGNLLIINDDGSIAPDLISNIIPCIPFTLENGNVVCSETYSDLVNLFQCNKDFRTVYLLNYNVNSSGGSVDIYYPQYLGYDSGGEQIRFVNSQGSMLKTVVFNADGSTLYFTTSLGDSSGGNGTGSSITEATVSNWGFTKNTGTYSKPSSGIPKSDLASDVQTSLGKADTALQSVPNTYATKDYVDENSSGITKITYAQYNVLSSSEKENGVYYITDYPDATTGVVIGDGASSGNGVTTEMYNALLDVLYTVAYDASKDYQTALNNFISVWSGSGTSGSNTPSTPTTVTAVEMDASMYVYNTVTAYSDDGNTLYTGVGWNSSGTNNSSTVWWSKEPFDTDTEVTITVQNIGSSVYYGKQTWAQSSTKTNANSKTFNVYRMQKLGKIGQNESFAVADTETFKYTVKAGNYLCLCQTGDQHNANTQLTWSITK